LKDSARVKKILKQLEVEDHKSWLSSHGHAWDFLNTLLKEEEARITKDMYRETDYESPNWTLLKADQSGQLRIIKKLLNIFKD